jgi:hypothetical protein
MGPAIRSFLGTPSSRYRTISTDDSCSGSSGLMFLQRSEALSEGASRPWTKRQDARLLLGEQRTTDAQSAHRVRERTDAKRGGDHSADPEPGARTLPRCSDSRYPDASGSAIAPPAIATPSKPAAKSAAARFRGCDLESRCRAIRDSSASIRGAEYGSATEPGAQCAAYDQSGEPTAVDSSRPLLRSRFRGEQPCADGSPPYDEIGKRRPICATNEQGEDLDSYRANRRVG